MKQLVQDFSSQLHEGLIIGQSYKFRQPAQAISNIIIAGMGGSGIAGSIVGNYIADKIHIPFTVHKDYFLPAFAGRESLVIIASYSGNSEETLTAFKQALRAKAVIICIASGGKIVELARKKKVDCLLLPAGMPARACIGFTIIQLLFALRHSGYLMDPFEKEIKAAIRLLNREEEDIRKQARSIARKINGKLPVIYAGGRFSGAAERFRQQLNENAKVLAWHHTIPEMNHNELVGWYETQPEKAVFLLRSGTDYERIQTRMSINKTIIEPCTGSIFELHAKGRTYWEQLFYFVHLTDWISVFLAGLRGVDIMELKATDFLESQLINY